MPIIRAGICFKHVEAIVKSLLVSKSTNTMHIIVKFPSGGDFMMSADENGIIGVVKQAVEQRDNRFRQEFFYLVTAGNPELELETDAFLRELQTNGIVKLNVVM